jgi:hypothetical protein
MKPRFLCSAIIVACAIGAILAFAHFCWVGASASLAIEMPHTEIDLGECAAGEKLDVVVKLNNNSSAPVRVIGLAGS